MTPYILHGVSEAPYKVSLHPSSFLASLANIMPPNVAIFWDYGDIRRPLRPGTKPY